VEVSLLSATVETEVRAGRIEAFKHVVPVDLTSIFTGYGPLPAVTGIQDQTGEWNVADQSRTVQFSDGSSAQERLTQYDEPRYFRYVVSGFTGTLRFLVTSARGEWWFSGVQSGRTHIKWRYAFDARSVLALPALLFVVNVLWRGYMEKGLLQIKDQIESNATS
jgi:hypothetical protein